MKPGRSDESDGPVRCPSCRRRIARAAVCACGLDLTVIRARHAELLRPDPRATVLPFTVMARLPPPVRRRLATAITRARTSYETRVDALHVVLHATEGDGRVVGHLLIAPAARYAALRLRGASHLTRRFLPTRDWPRIERVARRVTVGADLPADSLLQALVPAALHRTVRLHVAGRETFRGDPLRTAEHLDAYLGDLPLA